jgi:hypothetical protein
VLKFGGTSVGSAGALRSALEIAATASRERPVVIVVSALSGVTNALEAALSGAAASRLDVAGFAAAIREHFRPAAARASGLRAPLLCARHGEIERRLRAVSADGAFSAATRAGLLALGERLSVPIVEAALRARGLEAHAVDAALLVRTDEAFAEAAVDYPATRRLVRTALGSLGLGALPVVTGFLGATGAGETTLLGRGGSDLTAAVLGWALEAERVEIWSDVDGVMTAPAARSTARRCHLSTSATDSRGGGSAALRTSSRSRRPGSRSTSGTRCAPTRRGPGSAPLSMRPKRPAPPPERVGNRLESPKVAGHVEDEMGLSRRAGRHVAADGDLAPATERDDRVVGPDAAGHEVDGAGVGYGSPGRKELQVAGARWPCHRHVDGDGRAVMRTPQVPATEAPCRVGGSAGPRKRRGCRRHGRGLRCKSVAQRNLARTRRAAGVDSAGSPRDGKAVRGAGHIGVALRVDGDVTATPSLMQVE